MFSLQRLLAIFIKEFQQMLRDRLTFAMAIGVPILQLVLFGYAINTDPKGLPTVIVSADTGPMARSLSTALQNTGYFKVVHSVTGVRTLKDEMDKVASHNEHHLAQIRTALAR